MKKIKENKMAVIMIFLKSFIHALRTSHWIASGTYKMCEDNIFRIHYLECDDCKKRWEVKR